eukprot:TRINITY_DN27257_c0_g2_i1.p1 TRINITY_DN27257_c0_g2~~TRINITY_DN27257_c0_g2_i1.p1  ORF type:complete len:428 (+),score=127.59 TRINITY_DN27257_c0_g2_i1:73-1284(+)
MQSPIRALRLRAGLLPYGGGEGSPHRAFDPGPGPPPVHYSVPPHLLPGAGLGGSPSSSPLRSRGPHSAAFLAAIQPTRHPGGADGLLQDALAQAASMRLPSGGWGPDPDVAKRIAQRHAEMRAQQQEREEKELEQRRREFEDAQRAERERLAEGERPRREAVQEAEGEGRRALFAAELEARAAALDRGLAAALGRQWRRTCDGDDSVTEVRWEVRKDRRSGSHCWQDAAAEAAREALAEGWERQRADSVRLLERLKRQREMGDEAPAAPGSGGGRPPLATSVTLLLGGEHAVPEAASPAGFCAAALASVPPPRQPPGAALPVHRSVSPLAPSSLPPPQRGTSPPRDGAWLPPPLPPAASLLASPHRAPQEGPDVRVRWRRREEVFDGVAVVSWDRERVDTCED